MQPHARIAWRTAIDVSVVVALVAGGIKYGSDSRGIASRLDTLDKEVRRMQTERGSVPISVEAATRLAAVESKAMDIERRVDRLEAK